MLPLNPLFLFFDIFIGTRVSLFFFLCIFRLDFFRFDQANIRYFSYKLSPKFQIWFENDVIDIAAYSYANYMRLKIIIEAM